MRLSDFLQDVGDKPYRNLVEHHVRRQNASQLREGTMGETFMLPEDLQPEAISYIDNLDLQFLTQPEFWESVTCREAAGAILRVANAHFGLGLDNHEAAPLPDEFQELAFGLFQIATLSFAYTAVNQPKARKFMGIRKGILRR